MKTIEKTAIVCAVIGLIIGILLLMIFPLMWAWNFVVPSMFGLPAITYWQMAVLYFVASCLFKGVTYGRS